ncbi:zinc metalloproteinase nas-39-like [Branchiostoma lanceolatum]|uniref:zinc metalloproteinase nas-39-like n=1 Tax=Branchiostoma lanceolatum TaxID=7740 RepID=UPI0034553DDA
MKLTPLAIATSAPGCGSNLTVPPEGYVTSPNYPDNYGNDQTCEWTITAPEGSRVRLTFASFHLDDDYDFLIVNDGGSGRVTRLQSLTGELSVYPITSTSNEMFVRFTSDGSQTRQGFQFTATEISALGCGGTLTAPPEGTVTSPNHPDHYDNGQTCEWTITVPEGNYVHLTFGSFNLEESYDFLTIYKRDGETASLCQSLSGGAPVYPVICKSNEIFARFTSDHSGTAQGFLFSYKGVPGCGGTLTAPPGGIVKSPGTYNTDKTCEWTITVPEGSTVRLTFDSFHLDYDSDFWAIYDGDSGRAALLQR